MRTYDAIVIGGGKGGKTLAMHLARSGSKVALIEQGMIGGACINVACIPSKTMIASAEIANEIRHAGLYGIRVKELTVDFPAIVARKRQVVQEMRTMNQKQFLASGMDFIIGRASFTGPHTIEVTEQGRTYLMTADRLFIDTGCEPRVPRLPGIDSVPFLTNESIMELDRLPSDLIVLGGGYIGLEFGQMFSRFGSQVTILEHHPLFLPKEDRDIADAVFSALQGEGMRILLNEEVASLEPVGNGLSVALKSGRTLKGSHLLVAAGRSPVTRDLNLQAAGIRVDSRGYIEVDDYLQTSQPGVFALGDVKGGAQFTHLSLDDYRIVAHNLRQPDNRISARGRLIPSAVFIEPELARVGLTETEAREQGKECLVAKLPAAAIPRAKAMGQTKGLLKAIIDKDSQQLLGAALFAPNAGEMVASVQIAMLAGWPYTRLRDCMLAHPTMTEGLTQLLETV